MSQPGPARKALTVLGALTVAAVFLGLAGQVFLISGTKASFSFVPVKAAPAGGPGGGGGGSSRTTTTTTTATTTAATTTTSSPAATTTGGR